MLNFSNFVQKAQQLLDPTQGLNLTDSDRNPSKASLFQNQFRLPSSQHPLYEITAELTIPPSNAVQGDKDRDQGFHYAGKLHLSEAYMCFSTTPSSFLQTASTSTSSAFTGQTHGGGPSGNGFLFPLCAIRRVERLHSQNFQVNIVLPARRLLCRRLVVGCSDANMLVNLSSSHSPSPHGMALRKNPARK